MRTVTALFGSHILIYDVELFDTGCQYHRNSSHPYVVTEKLNSASFLTPKILRNLTQPFVGKGGVPEKMIVSD